MRDRPPLPQARPSWKEREARQSHDADAGREKLSLLVLSPKFAIAFLLLTWSVPWPGATWQDVLPGCTWPTCFLKMF